MFKVTKQLRRTSLDIDFWHMDHLTQEARDHYKTQYVDTGHIISNDKVLSEGDYVLTIITVWDSQELCDAFVADPVIMNDVAAPQNAYNEANGIVVTVTRETV